MRTVFSGLIPVIFMLILSSCQKEPDVNLNGNLLNDSTDITALIILDTSFEPGKDTVQKFEFFYDSEGRRIREVVTEYQPGVAGTSAILITHFFNYDFAGINPLPYTMLQEYIPASGTLTFGSEHFFFYEDGLLVMDSISFRTSDNAYRVDEFREINSSRYLLPGRWGDNTGVLSEDTAYSSVVWADSNLLSQKDTLILSGGTGFQVIPHTLTYDNIRNPFLRILLPYPTPCPTAGVTYGIAEFIFPTRNNIHTWNYDGIISTRNYEYGANGLPAVAREFESGTVQKWVYKYTKL